MKDFLFTLLTWLLTLPFIVAAIAFALYNQVAVAVTVNPFKDAMTLPMYVPVLAAVAFGFVFGSVMTWAAMGRLRKERSDQRKKIKTLEKQIVNANQPVVTPHSHSLIPSSFKDKP
jgi:uncharacterized integral membrane protein